MTFNISVCIRFQYHPNRVSIYNITHQIYMILQYHPYDLHIITISPISQSLRLPSPHSKDHIVPSHVHDNNITVHDTPITMLCVTVLTPIERLISHH
jgi:hypothetical protein